MAYPPVTHAGVVTSWIPLTTSYSAPASCSSLFRLEGPSIVAFDPAYGIQNDPNAICQPSAVSTWWEQGFLGSVGTHHTQVSILPLVCPWGWSTVATSIVDYVTTQAMCCPLQYSLVNRIPPSINGNCQSPLTRGQTVTYDSTGRDTNHWAMATTTMQYDSIAGAIAIIGYAVNPFTTPPIQAPSVQVQISPTTTSFNSLSVSQTNTSSAELERPLTTTNARPSKTSSPRIMSTHKVTSSTPTTPDTSLSLVANTLKSSTSTVSRAQPVLPVSVEVGIGIGAALGCIGISALLVFFCINRRLNQRAGSIDNTSEETPVGEKRVDNATDVDLLSYDWIPGELPGYSDARELYAMQSPREMNASP